MAETNIESLFDTNKKETKRLESEFKAFMDISEFPEYSIEPHAISKDQYDEQDYEPYAQAIFDPMTRQHTLKLPSNSYIEKYLIFHEFVHIIDNQNLTNNCKDWNICLHGYTEYHASQVELMVLRGAETATDNISFSMQDLISIHRTHMKVSDYIQDKFELVQQLFQKEETFRDINRLIVVLGVLFNYAGLRSICEKYACDYKDENTYAVFTEHMGSLLFASFNQLMHGWIMPEDIHKCVGLFSSMLNTLQLQ